MYISYIESFIYQKYFQIYIIKEIWSETMVKHIIVQVDDIEHREMLEKKGARTWYQVLLDGLNKQLLLQ